MARFAENNTDCFTTNELNEMNKALDILATDGFADDENHISDFINNAYPMTADEYVIAYKTRYANDR